MPPVTGAWRNPETGQVVIEEPVVVLLTSSRHHSWRGWLTRLRSCDAWDARRTRARSLLNSMETSSRSRTSRQTIDQRGKEALDDGETE